MQSFRSYKFCKCKTKKRNRQKNSDKAKDPWNKCCYKCEICGENFIDRRTLRSHIVYKHQVDYVNDYITAFGDPSVSNPKVKNYEFRKYLFNCEPISVVLWALHLNC